MDLFNLHSLGFRNSRFSSTLIYGDLAGFSEEPKTMEKQWHQENNGRCEYLFKSLGFIHNYYNLDIELYILSFASNFFFLVILKILKKDFDSHYILFAKDLLIKNWTSSKEHSCKIFDF